ncbi:hypothetical protein ACFL6G_06380 [candidate division KSB1 bacterium]
MLDLLKAELSYNKHHILAFFGLTVLFTAYKLYRPDANANILILFIAFITINNMNLFRYKENRDRYIALLPLPISTIGYLRIAILLIPFAGILIFAVYTNNFNKLTDQESNTLILLSGIIITIFCISFVIRDMMFSFLKRRGFTKKRMLILLFAIIFPLNLLTFFAFFESTRGLFTPIGNTIGKIESLIINNPFNEFSNSIIYLICCLVFMMLTVFLLRFRRSFLE